MTSKKLVDLRIYTIAPRKMGEFLKVFNELGLPVLKETLGEPIGMYTSKVGQLNQFVSTWEYESLADYEKRCQLRDSHPGFADYLAASVGLITAQENQLLDEVKV